MLLSKVLLLFVLGHNWCSADLDCDEHFGCEICTRADSWSGFSCRWCPLDRECHAHGSWVNHCMYHQNVKAHWKCEKKAYGFYNPQVAYEQALFSAAAYSADPQTCLDKTMPGSRFEVVDIINGSCHIRWEYDDCFAYTAVSVEKKTKVLAFRGTEEITLLTEQALEVLFKQKAGFKTGGKVQKYFANVFDKLYPCVLDSVGDLLDRYADFIVRITGHSLGGATASLSSAVLVYDKIVREDKMSLYTFGMPRVGDKVYAAGHDKLVNNSWCIVHYKDPVAHLPTCNLFTGCGFTNGPYHHPTEVYYHSPYMTKNSAYVICNGNEDKHCSNGVVSKDSCLPAIFKCEYYHLYYFGISVGTHCQQLVGTPRNGTEKYFRKKHGYCDRNVRKQL